MKKILLTSACVVVLSGCSGTVKDDVSASESVVNKDAQRAELAQNLDAYLTEQKDLFATVDAYRMFFDRTKEGEELDQKLSYFYNEAAGLSDNYYASHMYCGTKNKEFSLGDYQYIVDKLSKRPENVKLTCYYDVVTNQEEYNSDECILQRRATKLDEICWFNYSKYLPANTTIKSTKDFVNVMKMVNTMKYRMTLCDKQSEFTSTEKAECKEKTKQFAYDYAAGKAKHCRVVNSKAWNDMLKQAASNTGVTFGLMSQLHKENVAADPTLTKTQAQIKNNFGANMFQLMALDSLRQQVENYGLENLCLTNGWGTDIKKYLKK